MFGKAVVLAIAAEVGILYTGWKSKRAREGVVLRQDPKTGVYYDPLDRWEERAKWAWPRVVAGFTIFCFAFTYFAIFSDRFPISALWE